MRMVRYLRAIPNRVWNWFGRDDSVISFKPYHCLLLALLLISLVAYTFTSAWMAAYREGDEDGFTKGQVYAQAQLPLCQEDEVLYPVDYKGPGKNKPLDYSCQGYEDAVTDAVIQTLVWLGYAEPGTTVSDDGAVLIPPLSIGSGK